jgi:hypothetical protein
MPKLVLILMLFNNTFQVKILYRSKSSNECKWRIDKKMAWPILRYYHRICLEGLWKSRKTFRQIHELIFVSETYWVRNMITKHSTRRTDRFSDLKVFQRFGKHLSCHLQGDNLKNRKLTLYLRYRPRKHMDKNQWITQPYV